MRIGSLFSGYGGLDMAVEEVFDATTAWVSDIDKGACKILAHRYPTTPNLGDITTVDWASVEPVDIITGGSPCQDLSHAGKRQGMTEGTRSNLWVAMREAIAQLRPRIVVWENVRGAYSAEADSSGTVVTRRERGRGGRTARRVVYEGGLLENADGGPTLRALGRVLGDLADLGYDTRWHGLRAADVGAPHGRFRVFVVATDASLEREQGIWPIELPPEHGGAISPGHTPADAGRLQRGQGWPAVAGEAEGGRPFGDVAGRDLLPTPRATRGGSHTETVGLLPTPRATDGTKGGPNQRGSSGDLMLPSAVQLLGTPTSRDWKDGGPQENVPVNGLLGRQDWALLPTPAVNDMGAAYTPDGHLHWEVKRATGAHLGTAPGEEWGDYAAAIARWEHVLGRPAPAPTMTSTKGNPQLSPVFVEWLMGLPAGWVTDVPGITRNEALKVLGNGVVKQQCAAALRLMLAWEMAS